MGYTTARWEGATLVAETAGFGDQGWLDAVGHPHSDQLHLVERFQRPDFGHLELTFTIDDPKAYVKPFTVVQKFHFLPDSDLLEYFCSDNEAASRHFVLK